MRVYPDATLLCPLFQPPDTGMPVTKGLADQNQDQNQDQDQDQNQAQDPGQLQAQGPYQLRRREKPRDRLPQNDLNPQVQFQQAQSSHAQQQQAEADVDEYVKDGLGSG
jgi:hypothetical protein